MPASVNRRRDNGIGINVWVYRQVALVPGICICRVCRHQVVVVCQVEETCYLRLEGMQRGICLVAHWSNFPSSLFLRRSTIPLAL